MSAPSRREITVLGVVQGVGFRPFVHGLASRLGLAGFVTNHCDGVVIEVEGELRAIEDLVGQLAANPPPLARIAEIRSASRSPRGERGFRIQPSETALGAATALAPDVATCDDCLRELFDPDDRRFRYPFLNCTSCGPRLTLVTGAPYDRERTTMASFRMCAECRAEYEDPRDRRFHAQPIACPACGPRLRLIVGGDRRASGDHALVRSVRELRAGRIGAIKGLGGYHLACDAKNEAAVAELRRRKRRGEKPFAVMVGSLEAAADLCPLSAEERALVRSSARPIVLLPRRTDAPLAASVAPGSELVGLLLPYTPLHHLLLRHLDGGPLIMTSGNRSNEPIACQDQEAQRRLGGIADFFLTHDRPIHLRCDDSLARVVGGAPVIWRRARGYAPLPLALGATLQRATLALGGHLKSTFALGEGRRAVLSPHLGDLDDLAAYHTYTETIAHCERLHGIAPGRVVHDLHPDYASTRYAVARAADQGLERVTVQHHHAHLASVLAENGLDAPVIGVTFDGAGLGTDGAIWGGEFLIGDCRDARRAAHLAYVPLPGGERAIREPWRMAVSHLLAAGQDPAAVPLATRIPEERRRAVAAMVERGVNCPPTSSVGRLFDAVAALAGVCDEASFEGQAAQRLESLASGIPADGAYPFDVLTAGDGPMIVDGGPLVRAVVSDVRGGVPAARIARRFHSALVEMVVAVCERLRAASGLDGVALSGGVFVNAILLEEVGRRLEAVAFRVHRHRRVPPNDGGLCLGQLAVAAARDAACAPGSG